MPIIIAIVKKYYNTDIINEYNVNVSVTQNVQNSKIRLQLQKNKYRITHRYAFLV